MIIEEEAKLNFFSGSFDIIKHGDFVCCAVTNKRIPLNSLRYWSAELQEAYISAEISFQRFNMAKIK